MGFATSWAGVPGQDILEPSGDLPSGNTKPEGVAEKRIWARRMAGPRVGTGDLTVDLGGATGAAPIVGDRHHWARVCYSFRTGWLALGPFPPDVSGAETALRKEGAAKSSRRKVQSSSRLGGCRAQGVPFVCSRAETLVSTAFPTFLSCLTLKWGSISTL